MLEGKMIHSNFGRWEGVSIPSRETEALKRERSDQTTPSIADQDATSSDLDLDMLRNLCSNYKQQRAKRTKRQLEKGVISRVEAQ